MKALRRLLPLNKEKFIEFQTLFWQFYHNDAKKSGKIHSKPFHLRVKLPLRPCYSSDDCNIKYSVL